MAVLRSQVEAKRTVWMIPGVLTALAPLSVVGGGLLGRRFERKSRRLLDTVADKVELIARLEDD